MNLNALTGCARIFADSSKESIKNLIELPSAEITNKIREKNYRKKE